MSQLDFNGAEPQQYGIIPVDTIAPLVMSIRPGGVGDGGWLTSSKSSDATMLSCEFTVADGPFVRRKLWQFFTLSGGKTNEKGESIGGNISRSTLRAILESARNIKPEDASNEATAKRRVNGWQDFNGLTFLAKIGVQKGEGNYNDSNRIKAVITPDMKEYAAPTAQLPPPPPPMASAASSAPAWAGATPPPPPPPAANRNPVPSWAQ